ncbi:hypothetical protein FP2506_10876 [Fulvimarina pelagi HTCC2506]|uniref:Outer membrane beta-barrel protein n=2 Tax=Fulvimarina pelagi TaxID=217511 RepID=Q0G4S1_9HYPH|nr:hypothetical protein FP2506_10876 [Fulvimarina pelagi HTCC2506]
MMALPVFSQETSLGEIRGAYTSSHSRLGTERPNDAADRDRMALGQRRQILFERDEALSIEEGELLRELYQDERSIDRLDDDEYGQDEPVPAQTDDFDVFAGPEGSPNTVDPFGNDLVSKPISAVPPDQGERLVDEPFGPQYNETADGVLRSRTASDPAGPVRETRQDFMLGNPPLAAGIAGETLSSDTLLDDNSRARALERIVRPVREEAPYAPVGVRAGTLTIYPELYQAAGATTNIDEKAGGKAGAFSETEIGLRAVTDWTRHAGELNGRLRYRRDFGGEDDPNDPEASLDGRMELDFGALTSATLRGAIAYRRDDEIDLGTGLAEGTPEILSGSLGAEVRREIGRAALTGGVTVAREHYLSTVPGTPDLSYTTATATARAGYELSPAIKPFAEASIGRRFYDETNVSDADATIPAVRAGLELDLTEKVQGEIALGYAWSMPEEGETTSSPTIDANITWSPRRGTDLVFAARTQFDPEAAGVSSADYEASIGLLHALSAKVDLNGTLRAELETTEGSQNDPLGLAAEVGFTYWLNRTLALSGSYEYERRFEADPADDWDANTVIVGLRLQR